MHIDVIGQKGLTLTLLLVIIFLKFSFFYEVVSMVRNEQMFLRQDMENVSLEELKAEAACLKSVYEETKDMEAQVRLSVVMAAIYQHTNQNIYDVERKMAETYPKAKGSSGKTWLVPPKSDSHPTRVFYMGRSGKINSATIQDMLGDLGGAWPQT